jgi:hypothetical protein
VELIGVERGVFSSAEAELAGNAGSGEPEHWLVFVCI